jgi:hypothetical protein
MNKSLLVRVAILLMIASTLSGCLWLVEDDYDRGGGGHRDGGGGHRDGGDRGEHHGDRH